MKFAIAFVAVICAACHTSTSAERPATVSFVLVAPACSSVLPVQFSIDGHPLGTDTFRVAVSAPRTVSRPFVVSPGQHTFGAQVVGGYVWPPLPVSITSGAALADSLLFYCS